MGCARRRVHASESGRPSKRRHAGDRAHPRRLGARTPARRARHPGRGGSHARRHCRPRSGDCLGIVTAHGGPTSHAAVLARALGIPAVVGVGPRVLVRSRGVATRGRRDPWRGASSIRPPTSSSAVRGRARRASASWPAALRHGPASRRRPSTARPIEVAANVGGPGEVAAAVAAGADGIGLFRTEFLFMDRDTLPDEHEQEAAYRAAAEALDGRPLLVRTLDAGADKPVAALGAGRTRRIRSWGCAASGSASRAPSCCSPSSGRCCAWPPSTPSA